MADEVYPVIVLFRRSTVLVPLPAPRTKMPSAFEPAFADELAVILRWSFDHIQRFGKDLPAVHLLRDDAGGSVYLRLSTRTIEQPQREMTEILASDIVNGALWLRRPGPNAQIIVAYTGVVAPEAIAAVGLMAEDRRDVGRGDGEGLAVPADTGGEEAASA